jgi:hypothetical protein
VAALESAELGGALLHIAGWAVQARTFAHDRNCSRPPNETILRAFVDGLPFPGHDVPGNSFELGYGRLVGETVAQNARPDVKRALGLRHDRVGFDATMALPAEALTVGYHTVYLLALHPCDDRYNAVAQGSPRVYAVGMPTA